MSTFVIDRESVVRLCRQYGVRRLALFGSAARGEMGPDSDLDFLIEMDASPRALMRYVRFKDALEGHFGRSVDLVVPQAITNDLFRRAAFERVEELYAA